jgi:hypothetical protein
MSEFMADDFGQTVGRVGRHDRRSWQTRNTANRPAANLSNGLAG